MRYVGRLTLPGYGGMNTGAKAVFIAAVIAVLAAAAVTIPRLLPKSPEELYREDRVKLQKAVLVHITGYSPTRATHVSANSVQGVFYQVYPTWARSKAGSVEALKEDDAAGEEITTLLAASVEPHRRQAAVLDALVGRRGRRRHADPGRREALLPQRLARPHSRPTGTRPRSPSKALITSLTAETRLSISTTLSTETTSRVCPRQPPRTTVPAARGATAGTWTRTAR